MCKVLKIARSTFYHDTGIAAQKEQEKLNEEQLLKEEILDDFQEKPASIWNTKNKKSVRKRPVIRSPDVG